MSMQSTALGAALSIACLAAAGGEGTAQRRHPLPRWKNNAGMVFVRGGEFVRGSGHTVRVRSFYMDQYEVTNEQYCAFLNDGRGTRWHEKQEIEKRDGRFVPEEGKARRPVRFVAWDEAAAYAAWAGKRLPTEAEWEYAAGGKRRWTYPWGNEPITPERANFGGHVGHPQPVGSFPKGRTPEGVYDLSGNVAEWCSDWFAKDYYAEAPVDEPRGPEGGTRRIRRGGCYAMKAPEQTAAARGANRPDYRPGCIGFRCVRPARRVLLVLGENFEEIEFAAYTGVLSWASHTRREANGVFRHLAGAREVPLIEVVVAGFEEEVRGMGGTRIRPDVRIQDLSPGELDRFDAVAIPACVGGGRGRHTDKGQRDLLSEETIAVVQRVHGNGGIVATMCWAENVLAKADLPHNKAYENYPTYTRKTEADYDPLPFDPKTRTITSGGPLVATEAACLLLRTLVHETEYRTFRRANPWLFGIGDEFAPRLDAAR